SKRKNALNDSPSTSPLSSSSCNINLYDDSNLSTISSEVPKLSRLRSRKLKSPINSNVLQSSSGSEFDDSDFDPSYEPIPQTDTTDNILAENSDDENNMLNIFEPLNIKNMDLLVDFIENSDDDSNYIEDNNENNILFSFSKDQPLTSLSYESFNFNELYGPNVLPSLRLYWSADEHFYNHRISNVMTQKRFLNILRYLHLNDNSCDESIVGFKGRSGIKQYMPMKPVKRGFKIWAICCVITGNLLKFIIYEGKKDSKEKGSLGEKTVLEMTNNYQDKGDCVFFDRFFSSINLVSELLKRKIFACGTMLQNRKYFPKTLLKVDKSLSMGDYDFASSGEISVYKWMDRGKKPVVVVSSFHKGEDITMVKRKNNVGIREDVKCPKSIADYNKYMGGVDHFDQLLECYNISYNKTDELIGQFCSRKTFGPKKVIPSTKRKPTYVGRGRIILPGNNSRLQNVVITCLLQENIIVVGLVALKNMSKDQKSTAMNVRLLFA
ncbi:piggyBac transposable element-derived protein 4-like, partial [Aphis craccivora]